MPTYLTFALSLVPAGFAVLTVMTASNATIQLGVAPEYRGRVMAIYLTIFLGGTPIGAPLDRVDVGGVRAALGAGPGWPQLVGRRRRGTGAPAPGGPSAVAPTAREDSSAVATEALAESVSLEEAGAYPGAAPVAQRQRQSP